MGQHKRRPLRAVPPPPPTAAAPAAPPEPPAATEPAPTPVTPAPVPAPVVALPAVVDLSKKECNGLGQLIGRLREAKLVLADADIARGNAELTLRAIYTELDVFQKAVFEHHGLGADPGQWNIDLDEGVMRRHEPGTPPPPPPPPNRSARRAKR